MEKLFSVEKAAEQLGGLGKSTVYMWLSQGRIKRTKVGRRTMIRESELHRFLNEASRTTAEVA